MWLSKSLAPAKAALLAAALLFATTQADAGIQASAVVKLRSSDASGNSAVREGSGLLFAHDSNIYVLSSDHVLFRDNGEYSHFVSSSAWGKLKATFIFADWGRGISLLKVDSPPEALLKRGAVPEFYELQEAPEAHDFPSIVYGYPAQTDTLIQHDSGLANYVWMFSLMASAKKMAFLQRGYAEFGMSGGPVFLKDGAFFGVLSHILFWPKNGKTDDWTGQPDRTDSYVLIVPFVEIRETLKDYLERKSLKKVVWVESNEGTLPKQTKVRCSRLEFDARRDSQGFLVSVDVALLPQRASEGCPAESGARDPYPFVEEILSKLKPGAQKASVVGLRMERAFKFGSFMQIDLPSFHAFATSIAWSNIRAVFRHGEPEPKLLKSTLTAWQKEIDALVAHRSTTEEWKQHVEQLRTSFGLTLQDPAKNLHWTAACPSGIDEVVRYASLTTTGAPPPQVKKFLDKVREFTAKYLY